MKSSNSSWSWMLSVALTVITSTLYHFLSTMKWSLCCDYYPHFIGGKTEAKGSSVTSPRHTAIKWWSLLAPASHLWQGRGCPGPCQVSRDGRQVSGKAEETMLWAGSHSSASFPSQEKGAEGSWKARLLACSLQPPWRYNVLWDCDYKKRHSENWGSASTFPSGGRFLQTLLFSPGNSWDVAGHWKRKQASPYIINPKYAGGVAEIQETNGNLIHRVRWGLDSTVSRQACEVSKIRTLVTHSFNKHSLCITLCELCWPWGKL